MKETPTKSYSWFKSLLLIVLYLLVILVGSRMAGIIQFSDEIGALHGTLDLSSRPFEGKDVIYLNGEWEIHWQQFLYTKDLKEIGEPDLYGRVPEVWNSYTIDGENLPGFGSASYRLLIEGVPVGVPLAIHMDPVSTAYELYVDGILKAENGRIGLELEEYAPENKPRWVSFVAENETVEIVVQVSNHIYARGGIWYPIRLGTLEGIKQLESHILIKDGLLIGSLFIMAIYHLLFFLILKQARKSLVVIALSAVAILRIGLYGSYQIYTLYPELPYEWLVRLSYFTLIWLPAILYVAYKELFLDRERKSKEWFLTAYTLSMTFLIVVTPIRIFTGWIFGIEAVIVLIAFRALWMYFKALPMHRTGTVVVVSGFLLFALSLHDMLLQNNRIVSPFGELTSIGVVVHMFLIAVASAYDSLESYGIRKQLKNELREAKERQEKMEAYVIRRHEQILGQKNQDLAVGLVAANDYQYEELEESLEPCEFRLTRIQYRLDGYSILLRSQPVNLMILDIRENPRLGFASLVRLRELIPKEIMPVILVSEIGQENDIAEGLSLGASDFLTIPMKPWEFKTRLKNLMHLSVKSEELLTSRMLTLQSQIKPHFLFNTLSVLASMAEVNPSMTKGLIHNLADYLRAGIDFESTSGVIRLSREIEIVRAYVSIEQARFKERIQVEFYLEGDMEVTIPLLVIQPLVENAIRHGILQKDDPGKIVVSVINDGNRVVVEVNDDGVGMTAEEVERINSGTVLSESGIGLSNIRRRLQILCGACLSLESRIGVGTTVTFSILARKEVKLDESACC